MKISLNEFIILFLLKFHGRAGRYVLSSLSGISEGIVRRILEELKSRGLIESGKGGSKITERGIEVLKNIFKELHLTNFTRIDEFCKLLNCDGMCMTYVIRDLKLDEKSVVFIRDEAIRSGAHAVLITRLDSDYKIKILSTDYFLENFNEELKKQVMERLKPKVNDYVLIICGDTYLTILKALIRMIYYLKRGFKCILI